MTDDKGEQNNIFIPKTMQELSPLNLLRPQLQNCKLTQPTKSNANLNSLMESGSKLRKVMIFDEDFSEEIISSPKTVEEERNSTSEEN